MLQLRSPKWFKNRNNGLGKSKSTDKKYFSLMLIPSYTSGVTRSMRIPYETFHIIIVLFVAIVLIVSLLFLRTRFFMNQAAETTTHLEETVERFENFQEDAAEARAYLEERERELNQTLARERMQAFEERLHLSQNYQETLDSFYSYLEGLGQQLDAVGELYHGVMELWVSQSHIPPVRDIIEETNRNNASLLSSLEEINEVLNRQREPQLANVVAADTRIISLATIAYQYDDIMYDDYILTAEDLFDYIDLLEAGLEIQLELFSQLSSQLDRMKPHIRSHPTRRPIEGRVTSHFGWRRSPWGGGGGQMHNGIDISAPSGTPILATGGGTVTFSGWQGAYGHKVIIDHGFGIRTVYAHNSRNLVSVGQVVERGDHIANVGSTGNSTGPHVHYEVLVNGTAVNPVNFFLE